MVVVTVNYSNDKTLSQNNIVLYDNEESKITRAMVAAWIFSSVSLVFVVLVANLVFLHIFLISKKLTTFEYIIMVQERKDHQREMVR